MPWDRGLSLDLTFLQLNCVCVFFFVFRRNNKSIGNLKLHFFFVSKITQQRGIIVLKASVFSGIFDCTFVEKKSFFDENTDYIRERRVFEAEI